MHALKKLDKFILFFTLLLSSSAGFAQHDWSVNPNEFENSGDVTATVNLNGVELNSGVLAAFVGDECRGLTDSPLYFDPSGHYLFQFLIYSNENDNETISFKYYDNQADTIMVIRESVTFESDMILGNAYDPLNLNIFLNSPPIVSNPVNDLQLPELFNEFQISLDTIFSDPDDDALTYSASVSEQSVISVSTSGALLIITEQGLGTAEINVTTDDGTATVSHTFSVSVADVNFAPEADSSIRDQFALEGFLSREIDLDPYFSDLDNDPLAFSVEQSNIDIANLTVNGSLLTIEEKSPGTTNIRITASDNEFTAGFSFEFAINGSPDLIKEIPDQNLNAGFNLLKIGLQDFFSDPEQDQLVFSVQNNNTESVLAEIISDTLVITEKNGGIANLTVTASDSNLSLQDQFTMRVNRKPSITRSIDDIIVQQGFDSTKVFIGDIFIDPDNDDLVLSASHDSTNIIEVSIEGDSLLVTERDNGTLIVKLSATDGQLEDSLFFAVTVVDVNDPPIITDTIADLTLVQNIGRIDYDLDEHFADPENAKLSYSIRIQNQNVVLYGLGDNLLTLSSGQLGTSKVYITATDTSSLSVTDSILVTIVEENLLMVQYESRYLQSEDTITVCNQAGFVRLFVNTKNNWNYDKPNNLWTAIDTESDSVLNVSFAANLTEQERFGTVKVYDSQGHLISFIIKQTDSCLTYAGSELFNHNISIYPNPVGQILHITSDQPFNDLILSIYSTEGRLIMREIHNGTSDMLEPVNLEQLRKGVYFLYLSGRNLEHRLIFIKE